MILTYKFKLHLASNHLNISNKSRKVIYLDQKKKKKKKQTSNFLEKYLNFLTPFKSRQYQYKHLV